MVPKKPSVPTFTDGYGGHDQLSVPAPPSPPSVGPQPSGMASPSALNPLVSTVSPPSGSLPAGSPLTPPSAPALGPVVTTYATQVAKRASALVEKDWPLEDWFKEATSLLRELVTETSAGKKADPAAQNADAWLALRPALERLLTHGDASHTQAWVEEVCLTWWDRMTEEQATRGLKATQCSRAMPAYILARHKLAGGDRGSALRWASLAHAADRLGGHPGAGGAEVVLKFGLGVSAGVVSQLEKCADDELTSTAGDWKLPGAFPEMALTKALAEPGGGALVAPTLSASSHACHPFVATLISWINATSITNEEKGARLEWAVAYLAGTLPGAWAQRGFNAMGFACEQDVVAVQVGTNTYAFPGDAKAVLIECKNWESEARSREVGYFLARMKFVGARLGVLVAKSDITGTKDSDAKHAFRFLQGFCGREDVVCLVVKGDDLRELAKRGTFAELLEARFRSMTYGNLAKS